MAHTFDTSYAATLSNGSPVSFSYTCGTGATLLVLSLVIQNTGTARSGTPTYNGVEFVLGAVKDGTETYAEQWYYLSPPTGSAYTISIPNTSTYYISAVASSYKSASGASVHIETLSNSGHSTACNAGSHLNVTIGDVIVAVCGNGSDSFNWTPSQTSLLIRDEGPYGIGVQYAIATSDGGWSLGWYGGDLVYWGAVSSRFGEAFVVFKDEDVTFEDVDGLILGDTDGE